MFTLPNGKKIDEEMVMMGMEDGDVSNSYFLNTDTGEVERISEMFDDDARKRLEEMEDDRYIKIPHIYTSEQYNWMKEFIESIVEHEDPDFAEKLSIALNGKSSFHRFKDLLEQSEDGWIHGWAQWKADKIYEELQQWIECLPIKITEEFEGFDNCPICQTMKQGKTSEKELKQAFRKAREKGAIVDIKGEN